MSGTVFTDTDRVVSENVSIGKLRQRGEPNGRAAIIGKDSKGRAGCAEQSVIRDAVENRTHPVFANAEADVATARVIAIEIAAVLDVIHCRSVQIGAAAHQ